MTIVNKTTLKEYFNFDDFVTEEHMADLVDSSAVITTSPLSYSSTVNTDSSSADLFRITLTGNVILANPTGAIDGKAITWEITQGAGGGHSITLGSKFVIPESATTPLAWSTLVGRTDILAVRYNGASDKFMVISMVPGYVL